MKVLLAVDGSPYTKRMLAFLAARDEMLPGRNHYTVLTVVPRVPAYAQRFLPGSAVHGYYEDEAEQVMAPVRAFVAQQGWDVEFQHEAGHPGDVIAAAATAGGYDLVVLGSHGHGAVAGLVLGSVASRVLAQCQTPVLLIR